MDVWETFLLSYFERNFFLWKEKFLPSKFSKEYFSCTALRAGFNSSPAGYYWGAVVVGGRGPSVLGLRPKGQG